MNEKDKFDLPDSFLKNIDTNSYKTLFNIKAPEIDLESIMPENPKEKKGFEKFYENHIGKFAIFIFLLGVIVTVFISYLFK